MSDGIMLDTPEQINMWVLLSRRAQYKLHLKGYPVKGLLKWFKANIDGCQNARRVIDCVVPLETAIAMEGGPQDYSVVNVHVMRILGNGLRADRGVFATMDEVEANPELVDLYQRQVLEIVYTLEVPRPANGEFYVPE